MNWTLIDRYLQITDYLRSRYTKNGNLVIKRGYKPTNYTRYENMAWRKYILKEGGK